MGEASGHPGVDRPLWIVRPGTVPYVSAREAQKALESARYEGRIPDVLLALEHHPVYTQGRRASADELPMGDDWYRRQGIEIVDTDRGGWTTYHGPGQLVAYPIVDLKASFPPEAGAEPPRRRPDVAAYVTRMERAMIETLEAFGVPAQAIDGLAGVWTLGSPPLAAGEIGPQGTPVGTPRGDRGREARKIGSIGIHVNRGITTHGLAINVNNDLQPFEWIVPCRIDAVRMTSLSRELGAEQDLDEFATALAERFAAVFGRVAVEKPVAELLAIVPQAAGLAAEIPAALG